MLFTDKIIATSEAEAIKELNRLYPDADEFVLTGRYTSTGRESSRGHHFTFQIDAPTDYADFEDEGFLDGSDFELGEDEY